MTLSRLTLALDSGLLDPPAGGVAVLNAPGDLIYDRFADQLIASQAFFPDHARLEARGAEVAPILTDPVLNAMVICHRSKAQTLNLIANAITFTHVGGLVFVDGAKTDGIEPVLKELKRVIGDVQVYSKSHGKLLWFIRPDGLPDIEPWLDVTYLFPNGWTTHAASFSSDGPDTGSRLLAEALPPLKGRIADLGSGWGYLSGEILKSEAVTELYGVEADYHAVTCAKHNVQDPRAEFAWGDVLAEQATGFDAIVTNPPFHTTRKPDPALGAAFIERAADMLKPKGHLWMVANRNLPYEATLEARFRQVKTVTQNGGFKVIHAHTPKNARTGG